MTSDDGQRPATPTEPTPTEPTPTEPTPATPTWGAPGPPGGSPQWAAQPPGEPPTWGAPPAAAPGGKPPSRWKTWQKVTVGGALATVVAIGGFAAVSAANASSGTTGTSQTGASGGQGFGGDAAGRSGTQGMRGGMAGVMGLANALHGDFVVSADDGTQVVRLQVGEITALSSDSLTVTSTDGYLSAYSVGTGVDVSGLAQGDTVRVIGTVDGDVATATTVLGGELAAGGAGGFGQGGMPSPPDGMTPPNDAGQAPPTS